MTTAMTTPSFYFQFCSSAQNSLCSLMQVTACLWSSASSLVKLNIKIPGIHSSSQTEGCFYSHDLFCFHHLPEEMGRSDWPRATRRRWQGSAPDPRLELLTPTPRPMSADSTKLPSRLWTELAQDLCMFNLLQQKG